MKYQSIKECERELANVGKKNSRRAREIRSLEEQYRASEQDVVAAEEKVSGLRSRAEDIAKKQNI